MSPGRRRPPAGRGSRGRYTSDPSRPCWAPTGPRGPRGAGGSGAGLPVSQGDDQASVPRGHPPGQPELCSLGPLGSTLERSSPRGPLLLPSAEPGGAGSRRPSVIAPACPEQAGAGGSAGSTQHPTRESTKQTSCRGPVPGPRPIVLRVRTCFQVASLHLQSLGGLRARGSAWTPAPLQPPLPTQSSEWMWVHREQA